MLVAVSTLVVAGTVSMVAAPAFLLVARGVSSRGATGARLLARRAHATWWTSLGLYLAIQGALTLSAAFDALSAPLYFGTRVVIIPLLCAASWGITFYLAFLYTGDARHARTIGAFYVLVASLFLYVTFTGPQTVVVERWIVTLDDGAPLYRLLYALVGLPPILASVAYLALLRRVEDPEQRWRIKLLAGSILLYVGSGLAARLAASDVIIFLTLVLLGLAAAAASVLAYYPPEAIRRRFAGGAP